MIDLFKDHKELRAKHRDLLKLEDRHAREIGISYLYETLHWETVLTRWRRDSSIQKSLIDTTDEHYRMCKLMTDAFLHFGKVDFDDLPLRFKETKIEVDMDEDAVFIRKLVPSHIDKYTMAMICGFRYYEYLDEYDRTFMDKPLFLKYLVTCSKDIYGFQQASSYDLHLAKNEVMFIEQGQLLKKMDIVIEHKEDTINLDALYTAINRSMWRCIIMKAVEGKGIVEMPPSKYLQCKDAVASLLQMCNTYITTHKTFAALLS